jgi:hypothetical protein
MESYMKKLSSIFLILFLVGCQSTSTETKPSFATDIIEIEAGELSNFWVASSSKVKMLSKRPSWLPKGKGEWTVLTVIDSNGQVVERTLTSSLPEGLITQNEIDEMPKIEFEPSISNNNRIPVKFYGTAKIAPRSEL